MNEVLERANYYLERLNSFLQEVIQSRHSTPFHKPRLPIKRFTVISGVTVKRVLAPGAEIICRAHNTVRDTYGMQPRLRKTILERSKVICQGSV